MPDFGFEITIGRIPNGPGAGRWYFRVVTCIAQDWSGIADSRDEAWAEACKLADEKGLR